ncbi:MFS transporter [Phytomonospora sp. NPDC050363]|uniref:MFS transporter n=1 Tax=Phytomonospora sp. NPDC050363 TaxID=3155642 RepID=UPI0034097BBB
MTDKQKRIGMFVCLATIVLAVLDTNIVSAATVPIVGELDPLHGVEHMPWLVSAFALASTAALPLYGKLCDVFGAKRVFLGAVGVFMLGSALSGAAQDMEQLIAFRAVQGVGGGGLMSVTMVVIARIRAGEKDGGAKGGSMGGLFAGLGMAVGPMIGGLFADAGNWRWVFYINLPLGALIITAGAIVLRFPRHSTAHRIDYLGAALAAAFASGLLLITEWGGSAYTWASPQILGLGAAVVLALALFVWRQATAAEPILPLALFRIRAVALGFALQGLVGVAMVGAIMYVMTYLQVARGIGSTSAGAFLIPFAFGLAVVGLITGRLAWPVRTFMITGTGTAAVAMALLALTSVDTSLWTIRAEMLLLGAGFGQLLGMLIVAVQQAAPPQHLGVATTGIRFFQTLGGALGAAVFGSLLFRLYAADVPGTPIAAIDGLDPIARVHAIGAFVSAVDVVFAIGAGILLLALVLATRLRTPEGDEAGVGKRVGEPVAAG